MKQFPSSAIIISSLLALGRSLWQRCPHKIEMTKWAKGMENECSRCGSAYDADDDYMHTHTNTQNKQQSLSIAMTVGMNTLQVNAFLE